MKNLKNETLEILATKVRSFQGWRLLVPLVLAAAIAIPHPVAAKAATVCATINGGGGAVMQVPQGLLGGTTVFGMGIKLYCDGTASGEFHCIDVHGSDAPGNVWGRATNWSIDGSGVVSLVIQGGKLVNFPGGHPVDAGLFIVRIQTYGGAEVGHWTLDVPLVADPDPDNPLHWLTVCDELLTSGQIVIRYAH